MTDFEMAEKQVETIRKYWAARGAIVNVVMDTLYTIETGHKNPIYLIRSDMVNGLPRNFSLKEAA